MRLLSRLIWDFAGTPSWPGGTAGVSLLVLLILEHQLASELLVEIHGGLFGLRPRMRTSLRTKS